jgi:hypothetical protein
VQKTYKYLFIIAALLIAFFLSYKRIKHFVSPHYLDNEAVNIEHKLYSPDSAVAIVYYTLDVGARGIRDYKAVLRQSDYNDDLMINNLPPELVVIMWIDNKTLAVNYDPNEPLRLGGLSTDLDLKRDTLTRNGVTILVKERVEKENFAP